MRRGVRIGVDVGTVRIGVSACDPDGILASPVETVARDLEGDRDMARIAAIAAERSAVEVVIGLPRSMSGGEGPAARAVRAYAVAVSRSLGAVPVRLVDERLSTVAAHRSLRDVGMGGRRRRQVVDQAAAVVILQDALDAERAMGRPPGTLLVPDTQPEGPAAREGGRRPGSGE